MKLLLSFALFVFIAVSCHTANDPRNKIALPDTASFYPIAAFFKQQIQFVDLRNYPMYKVTVKDGKKDSAALSGEAFLQWADIFVQSAFAEPKQKIRYKETVFEDLSTASYTLNYTATDPDSKLRSMDILLNQETKNVKRVFIKNSYTKGDTTIEEQGSWKADKSFRLNRVKQAPGGYHSTELNYINWNE